MQTLPEQTLAAIGRMTVAATDLEYLLAWISADHAGAAAVFARPGAALTAARGAAAQPELIAAVEAAATQLALSHGALRRLWRDDSPADPAVFNEITSQLVRFREWLAARVAEAVPAR